MNKHIRTFLSVVDGRYGPTESGPMLGDVVKLNWLMIADNIYASDAVCCRLLGVDPHSIGYLRYLDAIEHVVPGLAEIEFSQDWTKFISRTPFRLRRKYGDYLSLAAFRSPTISYLAYFSSVAELLHKFMSLFREPMYNYLDPSNTERGEDYMEKAPPVALVDAHSQRRPPEME